MNVGVLGVSYLVATFAAMFSGLPIAFALGLVAVVFMWLFMPASAAGTIAQTVYQEISSITLLSIPLFILKGAAIGKSRAGQDLYLAMQCLAQSHSRRPRYRQCFRLRRLRGHVRVESGDLLAIGGRRHPGNAPARLFGPGLAGGNIAAGGTLGILLPPSITMILYAVAAEQSLGRLFLAGIGPGQLLGGALLRLGDRRHSDGIA